MDEKRKELVEKIKDGELLRDRELLVDSLPREQWKTFVWAMAEGYSGSDAYRMAYPGVKKETAWANSCRLLRDARVKAALDEILSELSRLNLARLKGLQGEALRVLARAARGEKIPKTQLDAARDILDRTGLIRREALEHEIRGRSWGDLMADDTV